MDDHKPSPAAARLYRIANLLVLGLFLVIALTGCASNLVMQMNQVCGVIPNHRIEYRKDGNCVFCYAEGRAVAACLLEDKGDE